MSENEQPQPDRLTRVETDTRWIKRAVRTMRNELRQHMREERRIADEQGEKIASQGNRIGKVENSMRWMKGIFASVQAAVLAWLGSR